ncbi:hypothetical protein JW898_01735 [Candidatus Woesearchaeota archaeon]|nr:hypothetical protein [Candidatus Woesearchaeota archaeon]
MLVFYRVIDMTAISADNMEELRRRIALLEWDIPNLSNEDLRKRKAAELDKLRSELKSFSMLEALPD